MFQEMLSNRAVFSCRKGREVGGGQHELHFIRIHEVGLNLVGQSIQRISTKETQFRELGNQHLFAGRFRDHSVPVVWLSVISRSTVSAESNFLRALIYTNAVAENFITQKLENTAISRIYLHIEKQCYINKFQAFHKHLWTEEWFDKAIKLEYNHADSCTSNR